MAAQGFYFSRLEARGRGRQAAVLRLAKGLNVVSGASDTGKSYLIHCLNFMTGAKDPPKPIPESNGYETLWLEIITWDGDVHTLERSLRGKDLRRYACGIDEVGDETEAEILKEARSSAKNRSISQFFLELIGCNTLQLRMNADGKLKAGSFRDFAHISIINEERIYTEGSPVRATNQFVLKTSEESFFKYLLTGIDDGSVIASDVEEETEGHRQARSEAIEEIVQSTEEALGELVDNPEEIPTQLARLKAAIAQSTTAIALNRDRLRQQQTTQRDLWNDIEASSARAEVLSRLVNRFALLDQHYESDLKRLKATAEVGEYLAQMPSINCPVCETENPWDGDEDIEQVQRACAVEVQRIQMFQADLTSTVSDIRQQIETVERGLVRSKRSYDLISQEIDTELLPAQEVTNEELTLLLATQVRLEQAAVLSEQIIRLRDQLDSIRSTVSKDKRKKAEVATQAAASTSETNEFCKVVEKLLGEWKFPDAGRVTFSETKQDLVINGKDRASHGKGIRALSYSAFVVGLLRFCRKKKRCHPGVVVLDSPLVAYREPDSKKSVTSAGVKENFYRSLAKPTRDTQVIIFENEDPPSDLVTQISYEHFSGDKKGKTRSGFFPA